jgi:FHA domain-containing protein
MDRLYLRHNSGHVITVDGNAQIGRGRGERLRDPRYWYTGRPKPPDFADLELVVDIDGSPYMSRNHVGIRREAGTYSVQDLNSLNGTQRNGVRMEPGVHYALAVGDCIALGPDRFLVGDTLTIQDAFGAVLRAEWYLGVAGCDTDEHMQSVFQTSVTRISGELYRRGYQTEVHGVEAPGIPQLYGRAIETVRLSTILDSLNRRAYAASAGAHTVFQFTGHGTRDGLVVSSGELLTPRMLFDAIGAVRGKKLLILDACHAGVFLADRERIPPQTVLLAATRSGDSRAYGDGPDGVDLPMTILARRLWGLLRDRSGPVDVLGERSALEAAFRQTGEGEVYVQEPGMNTAAYTVCLKSVFLTEAWDVDIDRLIQGQRARRSA